MSAVTSTKLSLAFAVMLCIFAWKMVGDEHTLRSILLLALAILGVISNVAALYVLRGGGGKKHN